MNLVVKVVLRQFDVPKSKAEKALDVASQALVDLAGDIEMEKVAMDKQAKDNDDDNKVEGWIDPRNGMSQKDRDELDSTVRPVQLALVKVSSNSDQILLDFTVLTSVKISCKNLHMQSKIPQQSYSPAGFSSLKIARMTRMTAIPNPLPFG